MDKGFSAFLRRIALVLLFAALIGGMLLPHQAALAAANSDNNVTLTITSDPDATGVNVVVFVTSRLSSSTTGTIGFDLRVAVPQTSNLIRSWAGNPNANPGIFTGTDVRWNGSVQNGKTQGPFVARFEGKDPFTTYAYIQYTGAASGNLRSADLTTVGLAGLNAPPIGNSDAYIGMGLEFGPPSSFNGIVKAGADNSSHIYVLFVEPQSPAGLAGTQSGDIILSVNGRPVRDDDDYYRAITPLNMGDKMNYVIMRDTLTKTLQLTFDVPYSSHYANQFVDALIAQITANRDNAMLWMAAGNADLSNGFYKSSIADFTRVISLTSSASMAYQDRAVAYYDYVQNTPNLSKATIDLNMANVTADLEMALKLDPANFYASTFLANLYYIDKVYDKAETYYGMALKANPTYSAANYGMGRLVLVVQKDDQGSLKYFDQAIKSDPYYAFSYYRRGVAEANLGNYAAAASDLKLAVYLFNTEENREAAMDVYHFIQDKLAK